MACEYGYSKNQKRDIDIVTLCGDLRNIEIMKKKL